MILAFLALLGISAWFIGLVLLSAFRQRKAVLQRGDIFWHREWTGTGWARRKAVAPWVSDVLVRHQALALIRTIVDAATPVEIGTVSGEPAKGLGADAVEIRVTLKGQETPLRLAVSVESRDRWIGPDHLRHASHQGTAADPDHGASR